MNRMPRNGKYDSLVTRKVIGHAYLCNGFVQSFVAFYTWIQVLNDYGIKPTSLLFIALEEGFYPENSDVYHPDQPNFGNSNFGIHDKGGELFWDGNVDSYLDMRLFYVFRGRDMWSKCRWNPNDESIPKFWRISNVTDKQICYTIEANKYGQGAFLTSIVCAQLVNLIICKTRSLSLSNQGFRNNVATFALSTEIGIIVLISYVRPFEIGLGTRANASPHFMVPSFSYYMLYFFWDEVRKIFVRRGTDNSVQGKVKYTNWIARNTFW